MNYELTATDGKTYTTEIDVRFDSFSAFIRCTNEDGEEVHVSRSCVVTVREIPEKKPTKKKMETK